MAYTGSCDLADDCSDDHDPDPDPQTSIKVNNMYLRNTVIGTVPFLGK